MNDRYVVGIGEALWDILPDGMKIGGAPANFAFHVSQFGLLGCVVSAVGNDPLGDALIENFNEKGLRYIIERVPYPTGTVNVSLDSNGVPQYEITGNVAWDNIPFTRELERLALNTQAVCFGSLAQRSEVSRATITRFIETVPETPGSLIVFDVNLRQSYYTPDLLNESMMRCNVLKINDEELEALWQLFKLPPSMDIPSKCRTLIDGYGLKMLILTCGVNGSYVFTPDNVSFQPTPEVEVADTVGAGDSFTATFIASLLRGMTIEEAHTRAAQISAYVCTHYGAMPLLPPDLL